MIYIITALVPLLLVALLFSKITFSFEYKKHPGEKLSKSIHLSVGIIKLDRFLKKKKKSKKAISKDANEKSEKKFLEKIRTCTATFKRVAKTYARTRFLIYRSLKVEKLEFHIKFGLGNAAITGIAVGEIWSLLYSITSLVSRIGTLCDHYFEVVPVYTEKGLVSEGSAKLSIRVINAISVLLKLYLTYKKILKEEI